MDYLHLAKLNDRWFIVNALWAEGRSMTIEQAIQLALKLER